ncbi:glutamate 5-kinase [Flavicella sediminum]|uniref:glutamate 5-kinase n=1 Tax=Flavicella sediminum TaxID=2585141 RepID=UPI00111FE6B7|nr:glutamate 5-kinase [Flavicella sediminum]
MSLSKRILVKIGSNVLTLSSGLPDENRIAHIVEQISDLKKEGFEVILVSSGAVAAGRSIVNSSATLDKVSQRQVLASIGQIQLMNIYSNLFLKHNLLCSQVLVTKESFRTRAHYLNIKNCLHALLSSNVTPIINENDVVSITELMFTDNDELSGLVAAMMDVSSLLLLSNVDGIFTAHPNEPGAELIKEYHENTVNLEDAVSDTKSEFGRGGMLTKANTAKKIADLGLDVYIGNGTKDNIIKALLNKETGTFFKADSKETSTIKKWVAQSGDFSEASIIINDGAKEALLSEKATSLLPVGVVEIKGTFKKGDVINIRDTHNNAIGLGKVAYDSNEAQAIIGDRGHTPLVHYNYLVLN